MRRAIELRINSHTSILFAIHHCVGRAILDTRVRRAPVRIGCHAFHASAIVHRLCILGGIPMCPLLAFAKNFCEFAVSKLRKMLLAQSLGHFVNRLAFKSLATFTASEVPAETAAAQSTAAELAT